MLPSRIGNRDPGPRGLLPDPKLLVDGLPSTALNTRINLDSICIRRYGRKTTLTPSSDLRQHCPIEMRAAAICLNNPVVFQCTFQAPLIIAMLFKGASPDPYELSETPL